MKIDITELEEVNASRGGSRNPKCSLNKGGYIGFNSAFYKINKNEMENKKSLNLKAIKKEDKLIVAAIFFNKEDEGSFKLNFNERKRSWFSGRNLFSQFDVDYKTLVPERRSIKLKTFFQNSEGKDYLIIEIPLKKK